MTATLPWTVPANFPVDSGVYPPQHDSYLLASAMADSGLVDQRRVLDLCCGSGIVAIAAAQLGAASVTAFDICPRAVRCSRSNAQRAGVDVDVREGSWTSAHGVAPFDMIVCNPPYVPADPGIQAVPEAAPSWTWYGGGNGRNVLGPLCESVSGLLSDGGTMLLVQSEFSGVGRSINALRSAGMSAEIVAVQSIPFGPVVSAHVPWLVANGWLEPGCREERLAVIRADKRLFTIRGVTVV